MSDSKDDGAKFFDFYEISGILAPGALFLFGLSRIYPDSGFHIATKDMTLGDLGLFAILSYAAGHLIQIVGDVFEQIWWRLWGGFPSDWVRSGKTCSWLKLLSDDQRGQIPAKVHEHFKTTIDFSKVTRKDWHSCFRQIYGAVAKARLSQRADAFNRTYGLLRGMTAGCLILAAALFCKRGCTLDHTQILLLIAGLASLARMHLFGRAYAQEVLVQFLNVHAGDLRPAAEKAH